MSSTKKKRPLSRTKDAVRKRRARAAGIIPAYLNMPLAERLTLRLKVVAALTSKLATQAPATKVARWKVLLAMHQLRVDQLRAWIAEATDVPY